MANSAGFKLFAGLKGSNVLTVGKEDSVFNFTDLASAVAAAKPKDMIMVYPGTYTQTAILSILKDLTIVGVGGPGDVVITSALTTQTVKCDLPVSHDATVAINFVNLTITNSTTGTAFYVDNVNAATAAYSLYINIKDCSITNSSTGYAFQNLHSTAAKDIFINITGSPVIHTLGKSAFAAAKAASVTNIVGMGCTGAFSLDANALANTFNMVKCCYASTAQTTGGGAGKLLNYVGNILYAATPLAGAATKGNATDFDATGTEAAILYA